MRSSGGFTLVELMITLVIIAILAGVAVPYTLFNLPTYRVNGAARQLVADFRLAKTRAVERGEDVLIQFDPAAGTYVMAFDNGGVDNTLDPGDETIKSVNIPALYEGTEITQYGVTPWLNPSEDDILPEDGVSFADDLAQFYPSGGAKPGSAYVRPSRDTGVRRDRERGVTVTSTTGRARLYRHTGSEWK